TSEQPSRLTTFASAGHNATLSRCAGRFRTRVLGSAGAREARTAPTRVPSRATRARAHPALRWRRSSRASAGECRTSPGAALTLIQPARLAPAGLSVARCWGAGSIRARSHATPGCVRRARAKSSRRATAAATRAMCAAERAGPRPTAARSRAMRRWDVATTAAN
ncbi:hypothetical protein GGI18_005534, partial [Coemansia linderi]